MGGRNASPSMSGTLVYQAGRLTAGGLDARAEIVCVDSRGSALLFIWAEERMIRRIILREVYPLLRKFWLRRTIPLV